jgi:putative tricarboxylic transport membrane protein
MDQLLQIYQAMIKSIPAFGQAMLSMEMIIALFVGVVGGLVIGALPGLNATTGIVLLMPITYAMSPIPALTMLMAIYTAGIMGGSYSSILINTPGTSSSVATLFDGFPLAKKGEALKALNTSIFSSVIGGIVSAFALLLISPFLARVALYFDSPEYFLLSVFGLSLVASLSSEGLFKGFSIGCLGMLIGCVGLAPLSNLTRYTFGSDQLYDGFNTTTVIIGCFSVAQIMVMVSEAMTEQKASSKTVNKLSGRSFLSWQDIKRILPTISISSLIGIWIGILPGAGAATGSYIAYSTAKKSSKHPEEFGHGCIEGIAAPESANNAVTGSAMIPLLTLGIPGSTAASVLLGALMIQGLQPGFNLFTKQADIVFPIIFGFLVANIVMLPIGILFARIAGNIVKIPNAVLAPIIAVLAVLGGYCIRIRVFDIFVVVGFGALGYLMKKSKYAPGAFTLGLILGSMCETGLRRSFALAMRFDGSLFNYYLSRPQSIILILLILFNMSEPLRRLWRENRRKSMKK